MRLRHWLASGLFLSSAALAQPIPNPNGNAPRQTPATVQPQQQQPNLQGELDTAVATITRNASGMSSIVTTLANQMNVAKQEIADRDARINQLTGQVTDLQKQLSDAQGKAPTTETK